MSLTESPPAPPVAVETTPPPPPPPPPAPGRGRGTLQIGLLGLAACLLLAGSGGLRVWQERQLAAALEASEQSPFPLESLPRDLGPWSGQDTILPDELVRATGRTDHIARRYTDQRTGVTVEVLVLYGPAVDLFMHSPEVCYPTAGYTKLDGPRARRVPLDGSRQPTAPVRGLIYTKGEGGQAQRQHVYYTWHYSGQWTPELGAYKKFQRILGMYKIMVTRPATERERLGADDPCEAFLAILLPEIDRRMTAGAAAPAS